MCGRSGASYRIRIDKTELTVCEKCSSHGIKVSQPIKSVTYIPKEQKPSNEEILVSDYGKRVQQARSKKGWTQEQLAATICEHQSIVQAAENNRRLDLRTARKLEQTLGIVLVEKV